MIYVTSDLHGYPKDKFLRFLSDSGFSDNDELYVLGDVIDRNGDGGVEMMRWIMGQPNVHFFHGIDTRSTLIIYNFQCTVFGISMKKDHRMKNPGCNAGAYGDFVD